MSEMADDSFGATTPPVQPAPRTAGGLLRAARQAQGLHIAALAASIKVVPRKLEWLEADQFDKLTDATFTRALAQTVCRTLKIDPAPVLALLPPALGNRLDQVADGLNTPFHERPGRLVATEWTRVASPALWLALVLVVAAVAVYAVPAGWLPFPKAAVTRVPTESGTARVDASAIPASGGDAALEAPALTPSTRPVEAPAVPSTTGAVTSPTLATAAPRADTLPEPDIAVPPPPGVLQLHAKATSWVEVTDARGQSLLSRLVQPDETVALDGVMPLKVKVGNAAVTTLTLRGEPVELTPFTRDNVAQLVLK